MDGSDPLLKIGQRVAYNTNPEQDGTVIAITPVVTYVYTIVWDDEDHVDEYTYDQLDHQFGNAPSD